MKTVVLLYWLVHGLICFQRPWMALLAVSTLLCASLLDYKRQAHSRAVENNEGDPTRPALMAVESVHFLCSTALSFAFFLRFLLFAYCMYWILWLMLSMFFSFIEIAPRYTADEAKFVFKKLGDLWVQHASPFAFALSVFDELLSSFQLVLAYGFYIVHAWNITQHKLYENDPWRARSSWAMAALLFYTAYESASSMLISIVLLTHIHNFFSQLQSMLNQREDFFGKRLILSVLWSMERVSFGIFKVGVPGFFLVAIVGGLVMVLFLMTVLTGIDVLDPPSNIYIE